MPSLTVPIALYSEPTNISSIYAQNDTICGRSCATWAKNLLLSSKHIDATNHVITLFDSDACCAHKWHLRAPNGATCTQVI